MKTAIYWIIIVGLLVANVIFYARLRKSQIERKEYELTTSIDQQESREKLSEYEDLLLHQTKQYQDQLQIPEELQGKIRDLVGYKSDEVLIYRYPNNVCSSCVQEDLDLMKKFKNQVGVTTIVFVTHEDTRNEHIRIANELRDINYLRIPQEELNLTQGGKEIERFFGKLDSNGSSIRNIFLPSRNLSRLTLKYFALHFNPNRRAD
ncbi:MAG: hypothetical protein AAF843_12710 [Bacteroidota bacterium]